MKILMLISVLLCFVIMQVCLIQAAPVNEVVERLRRDLLFQDAEPKSCHGSYCQKQG